MLGGLLDYGYDNQTVGTLSGHHSAMVHVYITGLGSWSSITATNIQGTIVA